MDQANPISSKDAVAAHATGHGLFQVQVRTGEHRLLLDEPKAFGGLSSGPSPFDLVCAALASCSLMTMRLYADRKGWNADGFSVEVSHRKGSPTARDTFERVLHLGEVTDEKRQALVQIAEKCPVHLLLERGADVSTRIGKVTVPEPPSEGLHARIIEDLCEEAA